MAVLTPLDGETRTLHVRCGSDIAGTLRDAAFVGDFLEHSYPYLIGPVREGPGCLEQRAAFLASTFGTDGESPFDADAALQRLRQDERALVESAAYGRVVIWSEHDVYDQLVLLRLLAHYATHPRPTRLELITIDRYPGIERFIGLGQLGPDALRDLWATRRVAADGVILRLGLEGWRALCNPDPRTLAALMRVGTPALPLLAPALHRHLRELPDAATGLGLTQSLALELLEEGPQSLARLVGRLTWEKDPLPGQGDLQVRDRLFEMGQAREPLFLREPGLEGERSPPWSDRLTITDLGRAVRRGEVDYQTLDPPARWVGGVEILGRTATWRWDEAGREARFTGPPPDA